MTTRSADRHAVAALSVRTGQRPERQPLAPKLPRRASRRLDRTAATQAKQQGLHRLRSSRRLAIIALSVLAAVNAGPDKNSVAFELVLILILGAGMLIGPSLSATSINGDSSEGVLAPLQMTRLTAADLAFGKLFASWIVCIAALLTTTPLLVYSYGRSGWTPRRGGRGARRRSCSSCLALTAVGLAWSSIAARAVASVSLTHLTTGLLVLGTLLVFVFTLPLVGGGRARDESRPGRTTR